MRVNLHCHTRFSDGSLSPENLLITAHESGLSALAVTDHDTFKGSHRAVKLADDSLQVIPAIELSTYDYKRGRKVHLLAYFPKRPEVIEELCNITLSSRRRAGEIMAERASKIYPISVDFIKACAGDSECIYKQHIMHALMETGFTDKIFGALFYKLFAGKTADSIGKSTTYPDVHEALEVIQHAGAISVLAHTAFYDSFELLEKELVYGKVHGVEVYHPQHDKHSSDRLLALTQKHNLLVTGGSDFHGMYSGHGTTMRDNNVGREEFEKLVEFSNLII